MTNHAVLRAFFSVILIITAVMIVAPVAEAASTARNGIDVLERDGFVQLDGLAVGLITNHTGRSRNGASTIDLLHRAPGVALVALFSPEHGIRGNADGNVSDDTDSRTGLPVHSLYREKTRKPPARLLAGLDALVFDIQDIGCRFYTYISTMGHAMEAAAENGLRFIVLDRVNPIGGHIVEGPVLKGPRSFTGFHEIPVRHGMTVGELARMFRDERKLDLELTVIAVEGWERDRFFDETGLPWVNPSPNMRSLTEALLYPGIGLLEFMQLSVGRGTATPFEIVGAPYIDPDALAAELNAQALAGVRFHPVRFTPDASIFQRQSCGGVRIELVDRDKMAAVRNGIALARTLYSLYPEKIGFEKFRKLLVHEPTFEAVRKQLPVAEIEQTWQADLEKFKKRREKHLLYE